MSNSVELTQVECPECAGIGAVEGGECPVCDGHGSVEGEARTISLHNIRYEQLWRGDELWRTADGRPERVGSVRRSAAGGEWAVELAGRLVVWIPDETAARAILEGLARKPGVVVTYLT